MGNTWLAIPSARPPEEAEKVLKLYRERGYKIALFLDANSVELHGAPFDPRPDMWIVADQYPGYAVAVNELCRMILTEYPDADWIVTGGDDVEPDPNHSAEEIARECSEYFGVPVHHPVTGDLVHVHSQTFGVMQPTGDRWAGGSIDRICGSPWMGREFCQRINGGKGPLWPEYTHMFSDEELQNVALKLGVFWQRRDLIHHHNHYLRTPEGPQVNWQAKIPEHLKPWATREHWDKSEAIFKRRKAAGFPGHEPSEVAVTA